MEQLDIFKIEKCIEKDCPYQGYLDTKKCWFHSKGEPLPKEYQEPTTESGPMTFKEAMREEEGIY